MLDNGYIGDIRVGRANLGETMPVTVYRLLEYSMREVLTERFGEDGMIELLREAGRRAGTIFAQEELDLESDFDTFVYRLQEKLIDLKIGVLRIEEIQDDGTIILTVGEDLDCSGLPITGKTVCNYDEGFLEGILKAWGHKNFRAREIDCWAKGDRVCRFRVEEGTEDD